MPFSNPGRYAAHSRVAPVLCALALIMAACTASTTIESVDSAPAPTAEAASGSASTEPTAESVPPTAEPAPDETAVVTDEDPASPDDPLPAATEVVEDPIPVDVLSAGTTQVVLLDAGAEPRVELRLMIAASCGEVMTIDQTQELTQSLEGVALPGAGAVGTVVEMATSAARVGDNYDVQSEIIAATASPGTEPGVAANMNVELQRMVGIATFVTMSDRGVQVPGTYRVEGAEVLGPLQSAVESISQVQAPLPLEAVGIGARWETTSVIDFEGASLMTVTEYLVTNMEGTLVDMQVSATQTVAAGSTMNMQGFEVEIIEWTGLTTGETTLDMATISPIRSVSTTEATQGLDFGPDAGGVLQQVILKCNGHVETRRRLHRTNNTTVIRHRRLHRCLSESDC